MATCLAIDSHNGDRDFIEAAWPLVTALVLADANAKDLAAVNVARAQVEAELKEARGEVAYLRAELAKADGRATALNVELREAKAKVESTKTWADQADALAKTASQNHAKLDRELADLKAENARLKDEVREARGFLAEASRRTHTESPGATGLTFRKGGLAVDIAAEVLLAELDDPRCVNMAHFAIAKKGETKAIVTVQRPTGKSAIELLREQNDRTTEVYQRLNRALFALRSIEADSHDALAVDLAKRTVARDKEYAEHPFLSWFDRERLGHLVRAVWVRWARGQKDPKPSWLVPWELLSEDMKEVDRMIGEEIARAGRAAVCPMPRDQAKEWAKQALYIFADTWEVGEVDRELAVDAVATAIRSAWEHKSDSGVKRPEMTDKAVRAILLNNGAMVRMGLLSAMRRAHLGESVEERRKFMEDMIDRGELGLTPAGVCLAP